MIAFSIREVVEQAIQTEKIGNEFYTSMAKKFHEENELKKLFETLAAQEIKHEHVFLSIKDKIKDTAPEGWDEVSLYLKAIVDSEFFLGKDKSLSSVKEVHSSVDAIKFALGFERETLLYYYGLRDMVPEKKIVDQIIQEEKSHIVWLSDLRKSFV
ncbi:MAG TPA: ferritin family protein [Thermodesulfovibrionales bacterium]|nr:ferritin family protein [Thermodesulfovibrionales bacterium]